METIFICINCSLGHQTTYGQLTHRKGVCSTTDPTSLCFLPPSLLLTPNAQWRRRVHGSIHRCCSWFLAAILAMVIYSRQISNSASWLSLHVSWLGLWSWLSFMLSICNSINRWRTLARTCCIVASAVNKAKSWQSGFSKKQGIALSHFKVINTMRSAVQLWWCSSKAGLWETPLRRYF